MSYEENLKSFNADADASIGIYTGVPGQPGSASPNGGKQYCPLRITGKNQVGLNAAKASRSPSASRPRSACCRTSRRSPVWLPRWATSGSPTASRAPRSPLVLRLCRIRPDVLYPA
jgi:hypothetical protein